MFSVIIPLYNKVHSVRRTIDSVLAQACTDFEIIVINDGSSDGSEKVVADIRDAKLFLHSQKNAGVSVARNRGVELSKYDRIAFLDADDEWHPQFLSTIEKLIRAFPKSNWRGTSYADATANIRKSLLRASLEQAEPRLVDYFEQSVKRLVIHITSVVMRKSRFLGLGGFS